MYHFSKYFNRSIFCDDDSMFQVDLLGVNMRHILGNATNCPKFNRDETCAVNFKFDFFPYDLIEYEKLKHLIGFIITFYSC